MTAANAGAFGREINREGRDGMVLLVDVATADDAIATATIGRYHNERWCCGMSVYEGFVFSVSSGAVAAGIADGTFPRSTDEWKDGRTTSALMSRGRRRRRHQRRSDRRLIRSAVVVVVNYGGGGGQIGGRTLWH